jgi:hypothetical protein
VPPTADPPRPRPRLDPAAVRRRLLLRQEVGRFRERESRRVFDTTVQVGVLGGPRTGFPVRAADLPAYDAGLRSDVVGGLLEATPAAWGTLLLMRAGTPEPHDLDLQWLAAARLAFGSHGRVLEGCYAVTRTGWRDVVTGEARTWTRLRL